MTTLKDIDLLKVGHTIQLAGAVYAGEGKAYLVMFPEESGCIDVQGSDEVILRTNHHTYEVESLELSQEEWKTFLRQTDLLETEVLAKAEDGKTTKAILRKSSRQIEQGVSWAVFRRDRYACRYCGADDVPLTVDHLVLWEVGGPSIEENLVSACRKCNKTRGNTEYAEWLHHPYYKKVSHYLTAHGRQLNIDLLPTLDSIPIRPHKRGR